MCKIDRLLIYYKSALSVPHITVVLQFCCYAKETTNKQSKLSVKLNMKVIQNSLLQILNADVLTQMNNQIEGKIQHLASAAEVVIVTELWMDVD